MTPEFPSLYWPIETPSHPVHPEYLYRIRDIWRFTLLWTLIVYAAFHITSGFYGFVMHRRKAALAFPLLFAVVGGIEATFAGSVVGLLLGAVYTVGQ